MEAVGEKGGIGETPNGRASSWDWPKAGADDCRPNGGGSQFRTLEACWTPLPDILHASGGPTWTQVASRTCGWTFCVVPGWAPNGDVAEGLVQATKQSWVAHPHPRSMFHSEFRTSRARDRLGGNDRGRRRRVVLEAVLIFGVCKKSVAGGSDRQVRNQPFWGLTDEEQGR